MSCEPLKAHLSKMKIPIHSWIIRLSSGEIIGHQVRFETLYSLLLILVICKTADIRKM